MRKVACECVQNATFFISPLKNAKKSLTFEFVMCILTTVSQGA